MSFQQKKNMMMENRNDASVVPLSTYTFSVGPYTAELVFDEGDLIIHLYRDTWPPDMKKRLIKAMDAVINDKYSLDYVLEARSWCIHVYSFMSSRIEPVPAAESNVKEMLKNVIQGEVDDGLFRLPSVPKR